MINGLDLFSGYGGLTLALSPWVKPILYCEIDRYAQGILLSRMSEGNLPKAPIFTDIRKLTRDSLHDALSYHEEDELMTGRLRKMTAEQIGAALREYEAGSSLGDLAHIYGVSRQTMWSLLKHRTILRPQQRFGEENHFYRGGKRADMRAHDIVERAVRAGKLVNPQVCEECNASIRFKDGRSGIQAHHNDYNKPLSVRWLCNRCHHRWHAENQPIPLRKGGDEGSAAVDIVYGGFP